MKRFCFLSIFLPLLLSSGHAQSIRVLNAASFLGDAAISPGSIISIFGSNLGTETASAADPIHPPLSLGGVAVTLNETPLGLFYVSPTQINAMIDPSVPPGPALVKVNSPTGTFSTDLRLEAVAIPGIFTTTGAGAGDGAILDAITFHSSPFRVTTGDQATYLAIFMTALNLSTAPGVTIGGVPVEVVYSGEAPPYPGLEQVNVKLNDSLAGGGRLEVAVESGGKTSNVAEVVILPPPGQGVFGDQVSDGPRSRELSSLACVPDTSLALVTDENDDVVRVVDVSQLKAIRVIALPEAAQPVAIGVHPGLKMAVVAERKRNSVAIIDLASFVVQAEVPVGTGPVSLAIADDVALVVNQLSDSVTFLDLPTLQTTSVAVGRAPRDVAVGPVEAYVTNQSNGTLTRIRLSDRSVIGMLDLGVNVRPASALLLPEDGLLIVTEPSAGPEGKVFVVNPATRSITAINANPDHSGGLTGIAASANKVYFASQTGGAVSVAPLSLLTAGSTGAVLESVKVELGPRALAVDTKDNLLLVLNQGTGTISLIDLATNELAGSIEAVRLQDDPQDVRNDHSDRERASNVPVISSLTPDSGKAGTPFTLTISGSRLNGVTGIAFLNPMKRGRPDDSVSVSNVMVNAEGTTLTAEVRVASPHPPAVRVVRLMGINGESSAQIAITNAFTILP